MKSKNFNVILSVSNDLVIDQRVHRVAITLQEMGYDVLVVGRKMKNSLPLNKRSYKTKRLKLFFEKGKLFYIELNLRLFLFLLRKKANIYTANDLDTLLPNFLAARLKRKKLIYDTHEYFTEVPELLNRPFSKKIWLKLENILFRKASEVSTVNQTIAEIYSKKYNKDVKVIKNVPLKKINNINGHKKDNIIIYQGNINIGRGVDLMLKSLQYLDDITLYIAGGGDLYEEMVSLSKELGVDKKVKFFGQVPMEQLPEITRQAAIGMSLEDPVSLNYQYCLPNKLLDYVQSGIPVIVSDLPEVRNIVEEYDIGLILQNRDPEILAKQINYLLSNPDIYKRLKENAHKAAEILCWENEKENLKKLYLN